MSKKQLEKLLGCKVKIKFYDDEKWYEGILHKTGEEKYKNVEPELYLAKNYYILEYDNNITKRNLMFRVSHIQRLDIIPNIFKKFHEYNLPGVTKVLDVVFGSEEFANIPPKVLEMACERGSAVHKSIEDFINTGELECNLEYQIYIDYFKDWYDKYKPQFIFSEQHLVSEKLGYKGIIDTLFLEQTTNELVMCDWKTSSNLNKFKALCQLNLYLLLLEENQPEYKHKVNKLKILSLTKSGFKYYEFKPDRKLAYAILKIYNEKKSFE